MLLKYAELGQYETLLQVLEEIKEVGGSASAATYTHLMQQVAESDEAIKLLNDLNDSAFLPFASTDQSHSNL